MCVHVYMYVCICVFMCMHIQHALHYSLHNSVYSQYILCSACQGQFQDLVEESNCFSFVIQKYISCSMSQLLATEASASKWHCHHHNHLYRGWVKFSGVLLVHHLCKWSCWNSSSSFPCLKPSYYYFPQICNNTRVVIKHITWLLNTHTKYWVPASV